LWQAHEIAAQPIYILDVPGMIVDKLEVRDRPVFEFKGLAGPSRCRGGNNSLAVNFSLAKVGRIVRPDDSRKSVD
jgi:hypothetical protein